MNKYEVVIGLEIHAQLKTESKMFCSCNNYSVDAEPNTNVCPVCLGMPGMLPVANKKAIEYTYLLGFALGAKVVDKFNFERKNYFYPDLPKAYQITSSTMPPVIGGFLEIEDEDELKNIRINHIHLEEDAGKLVHPSHGNYSLVDLNRAGTPLMEIVTEPDMRSAREARIFMQDLRAILRYLGISDANMEQGNLRCDANISLRLFGEKKLGTKVEVKNINSFKMIERAVEYEAKRQTELLDEGKSVVQETRGWDDSKGKTLGQRSKEEANDYRYFPEPDLPPFDLTKDNNFDIECIKNMLPELPKEKSSRFKIEYGLSTFDAETLTSDLELARYFEKTLEEIPEIVNSSEAKRSIAKKVANWIISEMLAKLNNFSVQIDECNFPEKELAILVQKIDSGVISGRIAKDLFEEAFNKAIEGVEFSIEKIIEEKGLIQINDSGEIEKIIDDILGKNEKSVNDFKSGKQQAFGFLVGQVMAATKGKANPKVVNELLQKKLE